MPTQQTDRNTVSEQIKSKDEKQIGTKQLEKEKKMKLSQRGIESGTGYDRGKGRNQNTSKGKKKNTGKKKTKTSEGG